MTPPAATMPAALLPRMRDGPHGRAHGVVVVALGAAALACTAGALYLIAVSNHAPGPAGHALVTAASCLLFVGTGLLALRRPPYVRFGVILAAVGFASLLGSLHDANGAVPYTMGVLTSNLVFAVLLHALLAFHHGHLASRARRTIAIAGYLNVLVLQAIAVVFDPLTRWHSNHPHNAVLITSHASLATALEELEAAIAAVLVVASLLVLSRRALAATPAARRQLVPVLAAGKLALICFAVGLVLAPLSSDAAVVGIGVGMVASLGVPAAFLGILVQGRLSRAAVGELLVELREPGEPPVLRDALRRALGDPTLELVRVRPDDGAYVDPHGRIVTLPGHGEPQMATRVFHQGEPVGALVHDRSLRLRPELLDAVSAAAGFALANERALESVQQIERRNRALLDAIPDPMIRVTRDGTYLDVRDDHCALLHPVDELLGRNVGDVLPAGLTERVLDCVERTLDEGGIRTLEYEIEVDGELRWKESRMVAGGGGDVVTIVRDFTEQRRAEAAQRRLADEQAALRRVATLVAGDAAPEDVFQAVTAEVCGVLGIRSALLLRYEQGETATIVGRFGAPSDDFLVGSPLVLEAGAARTVLHTAASVQVDYEELDGALAARMRALGFRWSVGVPINVAGGCWGALITAFRESEPFPPETEMRLRAFAELVGLAVASADARDELAASRLRIVEASDAERRRIERNLHDGAQQRLVGLSVGLRLARRKLREDPDGAEELLDLAWRELGEALTELRELAQGIHPALLTERGLTEALEVLAARTPLPVALDVQLEERLPEPVEAAAYYVVSEALANVVKHANAQAASVRVARRNGGATIEVADDGAGGADPDAGTGLWGLRDRVETLAGRLEIESEKGCGTLVTARIPVR